MADTAARLVDNVFPENVPVRQWVISLPLEIRYRLAYDGKLLSDVPVPQYPSPPKRIKKKSLKKVDRPVVDQIVTGGIFYMGWEIADEVYPNRPLAVSDQPEFCRNRQRQSHFVREL